MVRDSQGLTLTPKKNKEIREKLLQNVNLSNVLRSDLQITI